MSLANTPSSPAPSQQVCSSAEGAEALHQLGNALRGGAKLWEWAANNEGAIFTLLLRKSDEGGGSDFFGSRTGSDEGGPIRCPLSCIAGRWAGDRIALVGDYDSSKLWDALPRYRNISKQLVEEWNAFIEMDDRKLTFDPRCGCGDEHE